MEYATLQNGLKMPMEGFGVFQVRDKEECKRSVLDAIRTGYRLIDTAASYTNEDAVGEAVREAIAEGICTREELFITSYYIRVVFIDRSPAECYNKFRMLWIGMYHLPQRRF